MKKRTLSNGHTIYQTKPNTASSNVYYAEAGCDGKVVVIDFNIIPMSVILAAIAWEHDQPYEEAGLTPKVQFNKQGFRY